MARLGTIDFDKQVYSRVEVDRLLDGKQDSLVFDDVPVEGSLNPVTSDGIRRAIDSASPGVGVVLRWCGSVPDYDDLPVDGVRPGDVYNVESDGMNVAATESSNDIVWDPLGPTMDLYLTKADAERIYLSKEDAESSYASKSEVSGHIGDTDNPHQVTKDQVGLGNADNTSDADKPISDATQTALDGKVNVNHTGDVSITGRLTVTGSNKSTIFDGEKIYRQNGSNPGKAYLFPDNGGKLALQSEIPAPSVQVQSDWDEDDSNDVSFIKNKPTIPGPAPSPSSDTPLMDGTGAAGTATTYARGDHRHPVDTSRMAATATGADIPAFPGPQAPSIDTLITNVAHTVPGAGVETPKMDGTGAVGTREYYSREDHVHPTDTSRQAVISDLDTIRSGAAAGATAVQPSALSAYRTASAQDTIDAGKLDNTGLTNNNGQLYAGDFVTNYSYSFFPGTKYISAPENGGQVLTAADLSVSSSALGAALEAKANAADLATVATTGDYDDLVNKPTIPDVPVKSVKENGVTLAPDQNGAVNVKGVYYATCDTARDVKPKIATLVDANEELIIEPGTVVYVKFTNSNYIAYSTIVINGSTEMDIMYNGVSATLGAWGYNEVVCLICETINNRLVWSMQRPGIASTGSSGLVTLTSTLHSQGTVTNSEYPPTSSAVVQGIGNIVSSWWRKASSYTAGSYVVYDDHFYKAKVDIPANTAWNSSNWDVVTVMGEMPDPQVNSDWDASSGVAQILNKPSTFPPSAHTHSSLHLESNGYDRTVEIDSTAPMKIVATEAHTTTESLEAAILSGSDYDIVFKTKSLATIGSEAADVLSSGHDGDPYVAEFGFLAKSATTDTTVSAQSSNVWSGIGRGFVFLGPISGGPSEFNGKYLHISTSGSSLSVNSSNSSGTVYTSTISTRTVNGPPVSNLHVVAYEDYVDEKIGDINSVLDAINGEVI